MKITKRISTLLLALLLLTVSLAACGADDDTDAKDPTPQKEFSVGVTEGNTYTNEYFGFTATLDGWTFLSRDELNQLSGQVVDILDDDTVNEAYASGNVVMEMYAADSAGNTVNITVENPGDVNGAKYDEAGCAEASVVALPDQMAAAGYTNVAVEKTTVTFAGAKHSGLRVSAELQGVPLYETLALVKVGNYVASVTFATFETDTTAALMEQFKPL